MRPGEVDEGIEMRFKHTLLGLLVAVGMASGATVSHAEGLLPGAAFSIDCQDGAAYKLTSGRVTFPGDIVTGHLYLTPHRAMPVRLIPMGQGYRYAGHGVWLDGIRERALLYRAKYSPVACVVTRI
jgi:hypothetical protein